MERKEVSENEDISGNGRDFRNTMVCIHVSEYVL